MKKALLYGVIYGGIVGYSFNGNITKNTNNSEIIPLSPNVYIGGIVGEIVYGNIESCINKANIKFNMSDCFPSIGGIAGFTQSDVNIRNCYNIGNITAECLIRGPEIGGIVGTFYSDGEIKDCYNKGNIHSCSGWTYIGGIVGEYDSNSGKLINCYNKGTVKGIISDESVSCFLSIGGLAGLFFGEVCQNNYNVGDVIAKADNWSDVGGLVGELGGRLEYCYNSGNLIVEDVINNTSSNPGIGILMGYAYIEDGFSIENCYTTGNTIINSSCDKVQIGGIIGQVSVSHWMTGIAKIKNCYITGDVTVSSEDSYIKGMFIGGKDSQNDVLEKLNIENCYYLSEEELNLYGESLECVAINCGNKTEAEMKQQDFVDLLDMDNVESRWKMDTKNINKGFPILYFQ